ncbi:hypothetical protein NKH18_32840 [Streptomyces sp. M10(2022)]
MGKSSLVRHWQGTARSRGALTAVVDEVEVRGVVEAMEALTLGGRTYEAMGQYNDTITDYTRTIELDWTTARG